MASKSDDLSRALTNSAITRRSTLFGFGALALAGSANLYAPSIARAQSKQLTVSMSGGSFMENWQRHIAEPFMKATGATVTLVPGDEKAHMMSLLSSGDSPPFDVITGGTSEYLSLIARDKVLPLSKEKVPNLVDVDEKFITPWEGRGVLFNYGSIGLAYRTDKISTPPTSWKEFIEKTAAGGFERSVFFNNIGVRGPEVLLTIAHALTGDQRNIDAAFDAVKRMKPFIMKFFTSFGDPVTLLLSGDGNIGPGWDGRTYIAHDDSNGLVAWRAPDDGVASIGTALGVAKGGNEDLAYELVNFAISPEAQKNFCEAMFYGAVNNKVVYSDALRKRIPPVSSANIADQRFIAENISAWIEKWNNEIVI